MRAIDADALVNRIVFHTDMPSEYKEQVEDTINDMQTIEPEPHWIPCSERLPEENEVVLTQARFSDDIKMAVSARIDYNYWTGWGTREVNVVAWMPLPPVYQEEDNK